ncbi:uncharacterized protein F4822DRAFT_440933 [Hypoxylon trugodes]|uniref:uncharacterized protein n=1 Tax=Hypoxylon trugodes TaxID=326681 RepID=UPI002194B642|nr:uncharacterized protein F4822DRAFT_440933 [Hypoxylon trugodes]KAI1382639.1 hypothetical protein F4822DRAFT_440933 [Hypoxylon trugodes]
MFTSMQNSPRHDAPPSQPEPDSDSTPVAHTESSRKRPRPSNDVSPTAACDRCRLRKVRCDRRQPECTNCQKAGVECHTSNTVKRVNYTKQLRDEFSVVLEHLNHVDEALGTLTELTRQIAARPCSHYIPSNSTYLPGSDSIPIPSSGPLGPIQPNTPSELRALTNPLVVNELLSETVQFDQGGERLYGYPAPMVLIKSILHQAASPLLESCKHKDGHNAEACITHVLENPTTRATLQRKLDDFPFNSQCRESVVVGDTNPITTPPRLMVNLFVDGYLRNINTRTPVFGEAELHRAIEAHYGDEQQRESSAWALIINNIVLLELGLEIQAARISHSNSRGMNDDILPSFLKNCDRAIRNLEAFTTPSLTNVQALMTLTLVARGFYTNATAESVCNVTCQVGRAIGLHRAIPHRQSGEVNASHDSIKDRERLFRVLYALDKQRVFMTGQPCDLHMFDSDHQIGPDQSQEQLGHPLNNAFDHLMMIWEEIYLNLYTSRASGADVETRARHMQLVTSSLGAFAQKYVGLRSAFSINDITNIDPLQMELVYAYCVSQVLILRCERGNEQTRDKMHELARSSLKLLIKVCKAPLTIARLALLARIFRNYPMAAFVELVNFCLENLFKNGEYDSTAQANVSLLRAVCDQLQILQHDNLPHIFYARLKLGLEWAVDTLETLGEALARPLSRPQTSMEPSQQDRNSLQTTETPQNPSNIPSPILPDISYACAFCTNREGQGLSDPPSSHRSGGEFSQNRPGDETNFGFFTASTDHIYLTSRNNLPTPCQSGTPSSNPQPQAELGCAPMTNNSNWGDFSIDLQTFT